MKLSVPSQLSKKQNSSGITQPPNSSFSFTKYSVISFNERFGGTCIDLMVISGYCTRSSIRLPASVIKHRMWGLVACLIRHNRPHIQLKCRSRCRNQMCRERLVRSHISAVLREIYACLIGRLGARAVTQCTRRDIQCRHWRSARTSSTLAGGTDGYTVIHARTWSSIKTACSMRQITNHGHIQTMLNHCVFRGIIRYCIQGQLMVTFIGGSSRRAAVGRHT